LKRDGPLPEPIISHVSDTARWVAVYRARETERRDALFRDPLAARLAGERGLAIAAATPRAAVTGWSAVTRTKLIDDLVLDSVAQGCDRVVNLAAGFDTRPYRLALPRTLTWVEADLPALIDEKEHLLAGETPACTLIREPVDLADSAARADVVRRAVGGAARVLVITEGLVVYLDDVTVRALARDLAAQVGIRWWVLDLLSPGIRAMISNGMGGRHPARALVKFAPENGVAFFEGLGWKAREVSPIFRAAARFHRAPLWMRALALLPGPDPRRLGKARWSAVVRLESVSNRENAGK
jgi:methyltransferase (TIGR00027 family)